MVMSGPLYKRRLFLLICLVTFAAFAADIVDLREEIGLVSGPDDCPDNNITSGSLTNSIFELGLSLKAFAVPLDSSTLTTFFHALPYNFRAPPAGPEIPFRFA